MCTAVGIYEGIKRICNWCPCLRAAEICSTELPPPHALLSHLSVSVPKWLIAALVSNRASYQTTAVTSELRACHQADCISFTHIFSFSFNSFSARITRRVTHTCADTPHKHITIYRCNYMDVIETMTLLLWNWKTFSFAPIVTLSNTEAGHWVIAAKWT